MFRQSIKRQILGIAIGLTILMAMTSAMSVVIVSRVADEIDRLTTGYVPAYSHLARMNIRTLERALALRRMVIAKMQIPPDEAGFAERQKIFDSKGLEVEKEADGARAVFASLIGKGGTAGENTSLVRIDSRLESAVNDQSRQLNAEIAQLFALFESRDFTEIRRSLARIDMFRDSFDEKVDSIRSDMMALVRAVSDKTLRNQHRTMIVTAVITVLAAILGLTLSVIVSAGMIKPMRRLLEGTRDVEAGQLDKSIDVTTADEIGQLTTAFNRMVEELRKKEKVREIFGKYIDPQVVQGLIEHPAATAADGQRRIMTVLFCDMVGFTGASEGMTPQGLVKVMNHYLSTMSEPIRLQRGIIDKYIGDAIMAYWGPPFVDASVQAGLACLAAVEMLGRVDAMRRELPELLGVRALAVECDIRIGIATGEVLVGSIGSQFMMSYTVMGDAVNLASRLEGANKEYGSRNLVSEATYAAAGRLIEFREIDRLVVIGQSVSRAIFEIMGKVGDLTPAQILLKINYSKGLAAYRARSWDVAQAAFKEALDAVPGDGPSVTLSRRIETFRINSPPDSWDGAWSMDHK